MNKNALVVGGIMLGVELISVLVYLISNYVGSINLVRTASLTAVIAFTFTGLFLLIYGAVHE